LSLLGVIAGSLSVFALFALFTAVDAGAGKRRTAALATLVTVTAPLYWFTAARPLSDMPGLTAALAVQAAILTATTRAGLSAGSALAGLAAGVRSQVVWLTAPLIALTIVRRPARERAAAAVAAAAAFAIGALAWAVPLVALNGGPVVYWRTLFSQGAEDLSGIQMLWTTHTVRQLLIALNSALVAPWAIPAVATAMILLAAGGAVRLWRRGRQPGGAGAAGLPAPPAVALAVAFGPYLVFDLLFQESITTRYALPLIPPVSYLAVRAVEGFEWPRTAGFAAVAAFNVVLGITALSGYSSAAAPAFQMLDDMSVQAARDRLRSGSRGEIDGRAATLPVLAMHRREDFDLRRPIVWVGDRMPRFSRRLTAPPKHEWLELVKYWNGGGRDEVWFVADPLRSDLALIDHAADRTGKYRWPFQHHLLIGGVRPDVMDWYRLRDPAWYLGEGWSLTPETAGVAREDGRGPGFAPIQGWIRRRIGDTTLMIGGRNLAVHGPPARTRLAIDGRTIDEPQLPPGFFLRMLRLPSGALDGSGEYATIAVSADQPGVAIEQFNAQTSNRVVFGFGEGWHEREYNPPLGLQWRWMSERAAVRVHAADHALLLTLHGEPPSVYFSKPSTIRVSAGGRLLASQTAWDSLNVHVRIPAELVAGEEAAVTIETDQTYIPAERSRRSADRRRLGLRVFECELVPAY
jgi:hypothetical protein